ncbi:hypothetical protein CUJ84_Chr001047 [Rhizobium leguminosarum]|uniref:Uncharacterized protein n=1 Tax=Rhizobium leguminosarum TaxID=384 RepID=A0A2K9YZR3_RHILE|nr:hypothetical protein CUJ84_Chr001047 [Rhizobium leguminosarum]
MVKEPINEMVRLRFQWIEPGLALAASNCVSVILSAPALMVRRGSAALMERCAHCRGEEFGAGETVLRSSFSRSNAWAVVVHALVVPGRARADITALWPILQDGAFASVACLWK